MRETPMQTPRSVEERRQGKEVRQCRVLQPVVRGQAVPLQPMDVHSGADAHLHPLMDPTPEQVAMPEEGWDSEGSLHCCSSSLGGL